MIRQLALFLLLTLSTGIVLADTTYVDSIGRPDSTGVDNAPSAETVATDVPANPDTDTTAIDTATCADTVLFTAGGLLRSFIPITDPENRENQLTQNPTAALFKSLLVPGLGQFGNGSYRKAVLFFGLDVWMIGSAIHYGRQASTFKDLYEKATEVSLRNDYHSLYQDRKDERNKLTWFAVIITFVSMFDAYVDAHLSGFPIDGEDDRIGLRIEPVRDGDVFAAVTFSF